MNQAVMTYVALGAAITLEVVGTTFLQKSAQFTKLIPTVMMAICYLGSFYLLTHALKTIPLGIAYAVWSGCGVVLVTVIGWAVFKQTLDLAAVIGLGLIVAGVVVVNLFSSSVNH